MNELVENITRALVKNPDAVSVNVAPEDMGKVIGRKGRIANAIRTVVKAGALKENKKVAVDILEEVH